MKTKSVCWLLVQITLQITTMKARTTQRTSVTPQNTDPGSSAKSMEERCIKASNDAIDSALTFIASIEIDLRRIERRRGAFVLSRDFGKDEMR
jgi:hypothetical protein